MLWEASIATPIFPARFLAEDIEERAGQIPDNCARLAACMRPRPLRVRYAQGSLEIHLELVVV